MLIQWADDESTMEHAKQINWKDETKSDDKSRKVRKSENKNRCSTCSNRDESSSSNSFLNDSRFVFKLGRGMK